MVQEHPHGLMTEYTDTFHHGGYAFRLVAYHVSGASPGMGGQDEWTVSAVSDEQPDLHFDLTPDELRGVESAEMAFLRVQGKITTYMDLNPETHPEPYP